VGMGMGIKWSEWGGGWVQNILPCPRSLDHAAGDVGWSLYTTADNRKVTVLIGLDLPAAIDEIKKNCMNFCIKIRSKLRSLLLRRTGATGSVDIIYSYRSFASHSQ